MKVLAINGSPNKAGFNAGAMEIAAAALERRGVEVERLHLADIEIRDCLGCFQCLKSGACPLRDGVDGAIEKMRAADGFVVASPVRNGLTTALYKRFYERITYRLGFPLHLADKYTLAISSVGMAGGAGTNKRLLGLQDVCHTRLSGFVFARSGFPRKSAPDAWRPKLEQAAERLARDIETRRPRAWGDRLSFALDRWVVRRFILQRSPEETAYVRQHWTEKGYLRG